MARKRKNGSGTVRLRKDGRWEGRHIVGYDADGRARTKDVLARTKGECLEKLRAVQEEYGAAAPLRLEPSMPLGDWLTYWFENHASPAVRPTTRDSYRQWIEVHLIPALGSVPLDRLTGEDCQKFLNDLKENGRKVGREKKGPGLSARSVRSCCHVLRMALGRAVKEKLIRKNPALCCKLPQLPCDEMKILSEEEIRRFLIQAKEEGLYEFFLLELMTGMRRGEILALTWDDLDWETGALRINKQVTLAGGKELLCAPKTKAAIRTVVLPPVMVDVLREYRKRSFTPLLFPSRILPEQPIDPGQIRKRLHRILKHSGCKDLRFHDLRHTFTTMSLENGMDIKTLSAIIGHASALTTLDVYTHITNEMQENAAEQIDRGIAKAEPVQSRPEETEKPEAFVPWKPKRRRPGTGYLKEIRENLWEGRYSPTWPDGKKHARNVYGHTREECEEKLEALILRMNAEIAALRSGGTGECPDGVSPKKKQLAAYLSEHPEKTCKAQIARELQMDIGTVRRYWREIRDDESRSA